MGDTTGIGVDRSVPGQARQPGGGVSAQEERPPHVRAADVEPGMLLHNPYGGRDGWFTVATAPREAGDGAVEIDAVDGRTGRFKAGFRLDVSWRGMDARQAQAQRDEPELEAG